MLRHATSSSLCLHHSSPKYTDWPIPYSKHCPLYSWCDRRPSLGWVQCAVQAFYQQSSDSVTMISKKWKKLPFRSCYKHKVVWQHFRPKVRVVWSWVMVSTHPDAPRECGKVRWRSLSLTSSDKTCKLNQQMQMKKSNKIRVQSNVATVGLGEESCTHSGAPPHGGPTRRGNNSSRSSSNPESSSRSPVSSERFQFVQKEDQVRAQMKRMIRRWIFIYCVIFSNLWYFVSILRRRIRGGMRHKPNLSSRHMLRHATSSSFVCIPLSEIYRLTNTLLQALS